VIAREKSGGGAPGSVSRPQEISAAEAMKTAARLDGPFM
jgi:hypothetical protein